MRISTAGLRQQIFFEEQSDTWLDQERLIDSAPPTGLRPCHDFGGTGDVDAKVNQLATGAEHLANGFGCKPIFEHAEDGFLADVKSLPEKIGLILLILELPDREAIVGTPPHTRRKYRSRCPRTDR